MDIGKIEQLTTGEIKNILISTPPIYETTATSDTPINIKFVNPKKYKWYPCQDITTYELALCTPLICWNSIHSYGIEFAIMNLPDNARRHFEEIKE